MVSLLQTTKARFIRTSTEMYRRKRQFLTSSLPIAQMEVMQAIPTTPVDQGNSKNSTIDLTNDVDFDT